MVHTRKTILLVEDDILTRDQLCMMLQDGYDVLAAGDGVEASEIYEREKSRIDVVITDYMMPRLDGARLAQLLACHDAGLPIIMVSGSVGNHEIERLFTLPKFALLSKPFDIKVLLGLVEGFTGGP